MTEYATSDEVGAKGLAWTKYEESGEVTGGIAKFITDDIKEQLVNEFGMSKNSSVFFIAILPKKYIHCATIFINQVALIIN